MVPKTSDRCILQCWGLGHCSLAIAQPVWENVYSLKQDEYQNPKMTSVTLMKGSFSDKVFFRDPGIDVEIFQQQVIFLQSAVIHGA